MTLGRDARSVSACPLPTCAPTCACASLPRAQVRVSLLGGRAAVEELLARPLGNHVVLVRGHHRAALERYFAQFGPGFSP